MRHVAILGRAPSSGGKTRLTAGLDSARADDLRRSLLADTLDVVRRTGVPATLFFTPASAARECAELAGADVSLLPQTDGDLGGRMHQAFVSLFGDGARHVVLIGSDLPSLPPDLILAAFARLEAGDQMVPGPAEDGGYYLIGLSSPRPELFDGMSWGRSDVLAETLRRARDVGLRVAQVGEWYDVDVAADLDRVLESAEPAPRTREWCRASAPLPG